MEYNMFEILAIPLTVLLTVFIVLGACRREGKPTD